MILEIIGEIIKTVMLRRNQSRERGALIMARFRFSFISLLSFHGAAFAAWDGAAGAGFEDSMIRHVDSPYEETMATRLTFTESAASFPVRMLLLLCFSPSCLEADAHVTCVINRFCRSQKSRTSRRSAIPQWPCSRSAPPPPKPKKKPRRLRRRRGRFGRSTPPYRASKRCSP